jgi:hypothetical protein
MRAAHALFLCCSIAQTFAEASTRLRKGNSKRHAAVAAKEPDRDLAFSSSASGTAPNSAQQQTIVGGTVAVPKEFPFYVQGNG